MNERKIKNENMKKEEINERKKTNENMTKKRNE